MKMFPKIAIATFVMGSISLSAQAQTVGGSHFSTPGHFGTVTPVGPTATSFTGTVSPVTGPVPVGPTATGSTGSSVSPIIGPVPVGPIASGVAGLSGVYVPPVIGPVPIGPTALGSLDDTVSAGHRIPTPDLPKSSVGDANVNTTNGMGFHGPTTGVPVLGGLVTMMPESEQVKGAGITVVQ